MIKVDNYIYYAGRLPVDAVILNPIEADSWGFPRAGFSDSPSRAEGGL